MARLNPRITPHPNGTCTVSGIPYRDLCSILTSCTLHRYEEEERNPLTDPYSLLWHKRILTICNMLEPQKYQSNYENVPLHTLKPHQIAVRRRDAMDTRKPRLELDAILASSYAGIDAIRL